MNDHALQRAVDGLRDASRQRWVFGTSAVAVATAASAVTNVSAHRGAAWVVGLVALLALAAAAQPDSHWGSAAVVIVVVQWAVVVDDVVTPWVMVVAGGLLVFHVLVSQMALMPASATVDRLVVARWSRRTAAVLAGTVAMFGLVAVLDRRPLPGGAFLTVCGFAVLAAGAAAALVRSAR